MTDPDSDSDSDPAANDGKEDASSWWESVHATWSAWSVGWWPTKHEDFHAALHREIAKVRLQEGAVQRHTAQLRARLQDAEREQEVCSGEVERRQRERLRGARQLHAQARGLAEALGALARHLEHETGSGGSCDDDETEGCPPENQGGTTLCALLRELLVEKGEEDLAIVDPSKTLVEQAQQSWLGMSRGQRRARDEVRRAQCQLQQDQADIQQELRTVDNRARELETLRHHMEQAASSTPT